MYTTCLLQGGLQNLKFVFKRELHEYMHPYFTCPDYQPGNTRGKYWEDYQLLLFCTDTVRT